MDSIKKIIDSILISLSSIDGGVLAVFITILAGFIAWIYREVTYKPMQDSRDTFYRYTEKRIAILSEIRNILIILRVNRQDTSAKNKLKDTLQSAEVGYLGEMMTYDLVEIAYGNFNENLLWQVIGEIKDELAILIGQIEKESNYFLERSRLSILGRIIQFLISTIKVILISSIILVALLYYIAFIISLGWICKITIIALTIVLLLFLNSRWFRSCCSAIYEKITSKLKRKIEKKEKGQ